MIRKFLISQIENDQVASNITNKTGQVASNIKDKKIETT